jgi:hypothetical protein
MSHKHPGQEHRRTPLFIGVRGRGILRTSAKRLSTKFALKDINRRVFLVGASAR